MTPSEFLNLLWKTKPADLHFLIWTLSGKTSYWFRDVDAAAEFVSANLRDIYVGVGLSGRDYGLRNRCPSDKIAGIAGLWADFDLASEAHSKKPLPATTEEALSLIPAGLPPTIVIITGNGVHVWWLFRKLWIFANDDERKDAAALSFRFQTLFRCVSNNRGWAFERLADLARVLRIPGTINGKDVNNPKPIEVYSVDVPRYAPSDFLQFLDRLSIPDEEAEERAAKETAQRFANDPVVINQGASVPDEMLVRWMEQDLRFRNTWNRERDDLSDQSGSGYDMALACFGTSIGLSDQQIVDLIVHHRRIHGEQRRTRVDYYRRTISTARKAAGPQFSFARVPAGPYPTGSATPDEDTPTPQTAIDLSKVMLCDRISKLLRVNLLRLVKVPGKEPTFLMELENGRIEFDIAKLLSQRSVSLALAGKQGRLIPTFKPTQWRELAQMMLDACTVVEGTDDLELEGAGRIQIAKYLAESQFIPSINGVAVQDRYKPTVDKGKILISAADLQAHINRTTLQNHSIRYVAAMIAALGGEAVRVRGNSFKEQSRWALPVAEFDPGDYQPHQEGDGDDE
jgi:hypothetical protein